MKTIIPAADNVIKLLGKAKTSENYRMMHYVVSEEVEDGVLLFHTLTREMLLLSKEEYERLFDLPELYEKWFIVPEETNDRKLTDQIRFTLRAMQKKPEHIKGYTIFTTTECNARCFYCFEKGARHYPMSEETALKTVEFIAAHCGGESVKLRWFGGEPLYNAKVIDIITNGLKEKGIEFRSSMTTNGYLFDDDSMKRATELWNLRWVQITLDGTEEVYNQTKNYIYSNNTSPFETVLDNIGRCIENQIYVSIRLNVSATNADDLMELVRQLYNRFGTTKYLGVYSAMLFHIAKKADTENERTYEKQRELDSIIRKYGLQIRHYISRKMKLNYCQADNDGSVTVLPDGKLGACEDYSDFGFIGDIWSNTIDNQARSDYKECYPSIPECTVCFYYPECIRLKKCNSLSLCTLTHRDKVLTETKERMINSLHRTDNSEEKTDEGNC